MRWLPILLLVLVSCREKKQPPAVTRTAVNETIADTVPPPVVEEDTVLPVPPPPPPVKNPSGIYRTILPFAKGERVEHIVQFNRDRTFRLQETWHTNDSVVAAAGTWAPSGGFIWLYTDEVVRARYRWKAAQLQYYNAGQKKDFPMQQQPHIMQNKVWRKRSTEGITFFGIGNEPFWSIEQKADSLHFSMADWQEPVRAKLQDAANTGDSVVFTAMHDSVLLRVTVLPRFCSDGMSDFMYPNAVKVQYQQQTFSGCGVLFR
ncbi:MAG TPA: hypothetical protein VFZ78_11460 [Flavisolibacter sp.]